VKAILARFRAAASGQQGFFAPQALAQNLLSRIEKPRWMLCLGLALNLNLLEL